MMEYMVGTAGSNATSQKSNGYSSGAATVRSSDSNSTAANMTSLASAPLAPASASTNTSEGGSTAAAAATTTATSDTFDFSSFDPVQSHVVEQLSASAGLTGTAAHNVSFQSAASAMQAPAAAPAPDPPFDMSQQQDSQQQTQQQQYFVMPQQQVFAAFAQPATAALQTIGGGGQQEQTNSTTTSSSSTTTSTQPQQQQQQYIIPTQQAFQPAQLLSAQQVVDAVKQQPSAAAAATASASFYATLPPSVVSASTTAASSTTGSASTFAVADDDNECLEKKRPQNWNAMSTEDKRRWERNMREQQRSHKISSQIKQLRNVLTESNVPFKPNKYSILLSVAEYIRQLQSRAIMLDAEHRKLIDTIRQTSDMVNSGASLPDETSLVNVSKEQEQVSACSVGSNLTNDADMLFVKGLDYQCIFDQCVVAMGIAALDGRILDCNNEFQDILGYSKEELLRHSLFTVMQNHEEVYRAMGEMLKADDDTIDRDLVGTPEEKLPMYWSGIVGQTKQNVKLQANITLTRSSDGLPKFFNCSLMII